MLTQKHSSFLTLFLSEKKKLAFIEPAVTIGSCFWEVAKTIDIKDAKRQMLNSTNQQQKVSQKRA